MRIMQMNWRLHSFSSSLSRSRLFGAGPGRVGVSSEPREPGVRVVPVFLQGAFHRQFVKTRNRQFLVAARLDLPDYFSHVVHLSGSGFEDVSDPDDLLPPESGFPRVGVTARTRQALNMCRRHLVSISSVSEGNGLKTIASDLPNMHLDARHMRQPSCPQWFSPVIRS